MNVKTSNLLVLLAIAAIFLAPIGASYYLNAIGWKPDKFKNRGHLLAQATPMINKSFTLPDSSELTLEKMKHSWVLLYVGGSSCEQMCLTRLDELNRVHIALGKNQKRVRLLYLDSSRAATVSKELGNRLAEFTVLAGPAESTNAWKSQFDDLADSKSSAGMVFIIDPLGNAIMYYMQGEYASGIRKDMGRLLHVSRVG